MTNENNLLPHNTKLIRRTTAAVKNIIVARLLVKEFILKLMNHANKRQTFLEKFIYLLFQEKF